MDDMNLNFYRDNHSSVDGFQENKQSQNCPQENNISADCLDIATFFSFLIFCYVLLCTCTCIIEWSYVVHKFLLVFPGHLGVPRVHTNQGNKQD